MILVSYNEGPCGEWVAIETEIKTDLEPNATMTRILEMSEEGCYSSREQAWNMLVDEVAVSFGQAAAVKLLEDNPEI